MKTVIFVLLLVTTVFTVGSIAKKGNNKNIRNIYDDYGGHGNRGKGSGVIDLPGFDVDPGFGRHNGNGKGNKKGLRRDAIRHLDLELHPRFGFRNSGRYDHVLGNGRGLGRFPNGNDGLHFGGGNSNGRGNGKGNKKGLRRDAIRHLDLELHPRFGFRNSGRYDHGLGNGRGLGRFPNGNDGLDFGGENSNGRGNGNGKGNGNGRG